MKTISIILLVFCAGFGGLTAALYFKKYRETKTKKYLIKGLLDLVAIGCVAAIIAFGYI